MKPSRILLALIFATLGLAPALAHAGTSGPQLICGDGSVWSASNVSAVCDGYGDIAGYQNVTAVCQDGALSQDDPAIACAGDGGLQLVIPGGVVAPPTANSIVPVVASGPAGSPVSTVIVAPAQTTTTACTSYTGGACITQCADWLWSSSTGSGTCSGHGGILRGTTATTSTTTATSPVYTPPVYTPPVTAPVPTGPFIPYAGNGGGPTQCADGTVSHSSGRGTCSHHGGER